MTRPEELKGDAIIIPGSKNTVEDLLWLRENGFEEAFRSVRMPWGIGSTGVAFLEFLIKDGFEHLRKTMPLIWREKERLEKALGVKSDANFFIKRVGNAEEFAKAMKKRGILVRSCESFGLSEYVRFSVRSPLENDRLISEFKALP